MVVEHGEPKFFKSSGSWWCQSYVGHYLITGVGQTKEDAERSWKDEIKQLERELKNGA
jgi:hypothetical protein